MKTTSMAQYAALAANNSCLFALVNKDIAAAKSSVKIIITPIAAKISLVSLKLAKRYMANTGMIRRTKMTTVMIRLTKASIRPGERK